MLVKSGGGRPSGKNSHIIPFFSEMRASLSESTDFTGLVGEWQYLLKTLLMWLWWVCILMSDDTAVHCQRSKNYKRSDDLWRFACGDVFSSLTRSLVSLASLGLCFSSKTRPTGFLVLHGRVYNLRHLKLCHCSNRGFSVLLTLHCTGTALAKIYWSATTSSKPSTPAYCCTDTLFLAMLSRSLDAFRFSLRSPPPWWLIFLT